MLVWQGPERNEWIRELSTALAAGRVPQAPPPGAAGPFGLAVPERARTLLAAVGFAAIEVRGMQEPMWFGTDADDAYEFVLGLLGWMLHGLDARERGQALDNLRATLASHDTSDGVCYESAVWLIGAARSGTKIRRGS